MTISWCSTAGRELANIDKGAIYVFARYPRTPEGGFDAVDLKIRQRVLSLVLSDEIDHLLHPRQSDETVHARLIQRIAGSEENISAIEWLLAQKGVTFDPWFRTRLNEAGVEVLNSSRGFRD